MPAVGYAARGETGWWVFSGDTGGHCPEFWQRVNQLPLAALVIETAFSNREGTLARLAQHLAPHTLAQELAQLAPGQRCPIYITHTKPSETDLIMQEIRQLEAGTPQGFAALHDIRWLQAGDVLQV